MPRNPQELAAIAVQAASTAGAVALAGWRTQPEVHKKGMNDLVTEFDLLSERRLREILGYHTPEIPVVGEETGGKAGPGLVWYCDPIDGTTNFAHGHPFWAVSVGVVDAGVPVAGAVVAPALRTSWIGYTGGPALRNGAACSVSGNPKLSEAFVATGFPYGRDGGDPNDNMASFLRVQQAVRGVRRCGSAAIDCCMVADGTYDAFWERSLRPWDVAAGLAVVLAAGGRATALDRSPLSLAREDFLVSNGPLHEGLSQLVRG